jgi:HEAT repeat protein
MDENRKDASTTASSGDRAPSAPGGVRRAVVVAGHRHDAVTARAHLDNGDPTVRAAALGALERTGELVPDDLTEAARDPEPGVRRRVAELTAPLGARSSDPTAQQALLDGVLLVLLADEDDMVVEVAAFALGELSLVDEPNGGDRDGDGEDGDDGDHGNCSAPPRVAALAEVAVDHRDALCREAAVAALGAIGHPAGLPAVLSGCGDRASVRRRAVLALAAFDDKSVTTMLETLSTDRDLQVSQAAVDLLAIESGHVT